MEAPTARLDPVSTNLPFESAYRHGFARIAACTIPVSIADPAANARAVLAAARECHDESVAVAVFPELCLTGYSIEDLVMQDAVLDAVVTAVETLVAASEDLLPVLVVGAPLRHGSRLFNCAVVIHRGELLGVAPKSYLPTYREFYERRWYAAGDDQSGQDIRVGDLEAPFGPDLLFEALDVPGLVVHAEVCEDVWVPIPPSAHAALAGATVLLNLSGSPITIARAEDRKDLCQSQSLRCLAAYAYAAAGAGESTNDVSWDGQTMIYEGGALLAETERFPDGPRRSVADVDLDRLRQDRIRQGTFDDNRRTHDPYFRVVHFELDPPADDIGLRRPHDRFPFVPDDPARLALDCYEAFNIQVSGLLQRMQAIGNPKPVLGVSGGLDSTHALLVIARAMDRAGRPRSDILTYTMPGFATSEHTKSNAIALAQAIGASIETIDIRPAATEMLDRIGHPFADGEPVHDITFENVQAGLRTDYLFRLANQHGGFVVGTSDLSELALGWATYGVGDHMSHYAVNAGVPKTLIQHVIRWVVSHEGDGSTDLSDEAKRVLQSVLDTEISPELIPAGQDGKMQSTEDRIGPYALHDFALFHVLRYGMRPSKIAFVAWHAWKEKDAGAWPPGFPDDDHYEYDLPTIVKWLQVFLQRFFAFAQFKRSAIPNGPKVSPAGSLSPRGDWRAPSDGNARAWIAELKAALPELVEE
jgi:NAD+ synthase (glutamine-hydrolysing)